jgi:hypothetical protein
MRQKRFAPEKIISMLREAEVGLSQGLTVGKVFKQAHKILECRGLV